MRRYERSGVTVDQCTECRGIFLDRGELEQLFAAEANFNSGQGRPAGPPQGGGYAPPPAPGYGAPGHGAPGYGAPGYGAPAAYGAPGYPGQQHHGHYRQAGHHGHYRQRGHHGHYRKRKSFLGELFD